MSDARCSCCGRNVEDRRLAEYGGLCFECGWFFGCDTTTRWCQPEQPPQECDCTWKEPHDFDCKYEARLDAWDAAQYARMERRALAAEAEVLALKASFKASLLNRAASFRADADHMDAPKLRQHTPVSSLSLSPAERRVIAVELECAAADLYGSSSQPGGQQ